VGHVSTLPIPAVPAHDHSCGGPSPVTDNPVHVTDLQVGGHRIEVWADRPNRDLTRVYLTDDAGFGCGDAHLCNGERSITLPDGWAGHDKAAAACVIAQIAYRTQA
jgi:hypothetical protein